MVQLLLEDLKAINLAIVFESPKFILTFINSKADFIVEALFFLSLTTIYFRLIMAALNL
jgi:hypothetical protein